MNYFILRIKLLLKDRTAMICYAVSAAVILAVLLSLNVHAAERSSIPIGLVVKDESGEALDLKKALHDNPALYVYDGSYKEMTNLLLDGYINSIFIIEEGYGDRVRAGDVEDLILVYAARDDRISAVIGDITAGCMMYEICIDKAYNKYKSLTSPEGVGKITRGEYVSYLEELAATEGFTFTFDVTYTEAGHTTAASEITNGMIYRQMIAGMLAMLLMLITFCASNTITVEYENGIRRRLKCLAGGRMGMICGEIGAIFVYVLPLACVSAAVMYLPGSISDALRLFVLNAVFSLLFSGLFYACSCAARGVFPYQLLGAVLIVVCGTMGFINVFSGFLGTGLFGYTPVSAYIKLFIGIGG